MSKKTHLKWNKDTTKVPLNQTPNSENLNEPIHKTETDSVDIDLWLPRVGGGLEEGWSRSLGLACKILHTEWINKVLLHNTGTVLNIL